MVKVGNSECEFLKLTPLSRTSAMAGAVCGEVMRPQMPARPERVKLRWEAFCADATVAVKIIRLADSNILVRRIRFSPERSSFGDPPLPSFNSGLRQNCYIAREPSQVGGTCQKASILICRAETLPLPGGLP